MQDFAAPANFRSASPHAAPALRLGARLDLADTLAGQAEDLADVAEGELGVLQDAVAELENRLFLERQRLDRLLHRALLLERLEQRDALVGNVRRDVRMIAELV